MVKTLWTDGSIEAGFLIAIILLMRMMYRKKINPNVRYFMWGIVALRILLPIHLLLVLPSTEFTDWMQKQTSPLAEWIIEVAMPENTEQTVPAQQGTADINHQGMVIALPQEPGVAYQAQKLPLESVAHKGENVPMMSGSQVAAASLHNSGTVAMIVQIVWLIGALGLAGYMLVKNMIFYRSVCASRRLVTKLENGLPLYEAKGLNCLMGLIRPAIYMSPEVLQDERLKAHVLTHELQHYRVRDNVWVLVRSLCLILQWYNPLVWVAYVESGKDCELACDYRVTRGMKRPERVAYGESLLAVVSLGSKAKTNLATSMGEDKAFFAERLKDIMRAKKGKWILIPCFMLVLCAVVAFSSVTYEKELTEQEGATKTEADATGQEAEALQQIEEAEAEIQKATELVEAEKQKAAELIEAEKQQVAEQEQKPMIQRFSQEEVAVTPQVPIYTYEEAAARTTATEYRDFLPGASEGTWYVMELEGIEYFYARYDFKAEEQPMLCGAGYVIVGDNYALANGLKVGMTEEEVLALYPNMAVLDFEGKPVYKEVIGANIWNLGHYPQSETWLEDGIDYQWTDQFDYVMMGLIEQEDNTLPWYVGLMVKDNIVRAISFHSPTAG